MRTASCLLILWAFLRGGTFKLEFLRFIGPGNLCMTGERLQGNWRWRRVLRLLRFEEDIEFITARSKMSSQKGVILVSDVGKQHLTALMAMVASGLCFRRCRLLLFR